LLTGPYRTPLCALRTPNRMIWAEVDLSLVDDQLQ
jgi:hypothetical protein